MEVWFYPRIETAAERPTRRAEELMRATEAGAKAYIRKPFTVKDLSEEIEPLLGEKLAAAKG